MLPGHGRVQATERQDPGRPFLTAFPMDEESDIARLSQLLKEHRFGELIHAAANRLRRLRLKYGDNCVEVAFAFEDLGRAFFANNDFIASATQYGHALEILSQLYGEFHETIVVCRTNVAKALINLGRYNEAGTHLASASAALAQLPIEQRRRIGWGALTTHAMLTTMRGEFRESTAMLLEA